jgi:hypothetical protein
MSYKSETDAHSAAIAAKHRMNQPLQWEVRVWEKLDALTPTRSMCMSDSWSERENTLST